MGWVDGLRDRHRLIVMDARGHGKSDKPHAPSAYRMRLLVGDVTAVLDDLGLPQAHFLGYSMGGDIGFGIAKYAPDRATSLVLGGAEARDPDPEHPSEGSERMIRLLGQGRDARIAAFRESAEREVRASQEPAPLEAQLPARLQLVAESDPGALIAMVSGSWREVLHLEEVLPHLTVPCLLFVGEADSAFEGAKAASARIPHARFVSFPGLAHFETAVRSDLVLPHVLRFLADVDRTRKG